MRKELHVISTGMQSKEELIENVIKIYPYIDFIHLREKNWRAIDYMEVIDSFIQNGVPKEKIIVNDRIDVAQVMEVYGVQLAYHSIPIQKIRKKIPNLHLGCSTHSVEEAKQKENLGANYVIFGHVFPTSSKQGVPAKGIEQLKQTVEHVNIPVIAIGGITTDNIAEILATGASGVAVLSGILLADDVLLAAKKYREKLDIWKGG